MGIGSVRQVNYSYSGALRNFDAPHTIFQYTLSGTGKVDYKGKTYEIPPGSGFFVNSHDPELCYYYPKDSEEAWSFIYITLNNTLDICHDCCQKYGPVFKLDDNTTLITELRRLIDITSPQMTIKKHQALDLVHLVVSSVFKAHEVNQEGSSALYLVNQVWNFIEKHLHSPLSVDIIAKGLGITREHLSRVYSQEEGESLSAHLRRIKVREAQRLLLNGDRRVQEVANTLGFDNVSNFIRHFKKEVGITPGEFLRSHFK